MKLRFILSLLLLSLLINSYAAVNGAQEIRVKGRFEDIGSRSVYEPVISAMKTDEIIIVNFTKALGVINITINSVNQQLYNAIENVKYSFQYMINIADYPSGTYLIEFTNAANKRMYGEFVI